MHLVSPKNFLLEETMAHSITLPSLQGHLKSHFFGQTILSDRPGRSSFPLSRHQSRFPCAKFNLSELLGGRGLCNGEEGIEKELKKSMEEPSSSSAAADVKNEENSTSLAISGADSVPEDGFDKEMMGLTGGFPGGETGLQRFIQENPPPKNQSGADSGNEVEINTSKKPKPPELPLLMPGMIAIVKNPNNPFYMYCGIVQRITDGKAGVLFEGGNWDRLVTFRLEELERREKGPPMKNPKSCILESMIEQDSK
ncbi:hypothetical protein HS088_TW15G00495 [Tripterygium wilfordii]|uniref:NAD(P)H-quinone oxidoreductase subunit S chloroplastic n=1 Tax=Tripterygium wilfordii TaxID=458696 RepID=A0A7J7CM25_TRIWF|nr:NAD(P)H-quinone oxidoreductase subunit S, chloroplastic [Tripterygium wilfordii]KAF5734996.1 hypothetical protein HS088_TW15G00495 [Tripterygium wilfordii]